MTTYPLDKPSYFYLKALLLKWIMPVKEYYYEYEDEYEQNGKFQFWVIFT